MPSPFDSDNSRLEELLSGEPCSISEIQPLRKKEKDFKIIVIYLPVVDLWDTGVALLGKLSLGESSSSSPEVA